MTSVLESKSTTSPNKDWLGLLMILKPSSYLNFLYEKYVKEHKATAQAVNNGANSIGNGALFFLDSCNSLKVGLNIVVEYICDGL